jgi:GNAT superfamily N-acetyltransferase
VSGGRRSQDSRQLAAARAEAALADVRVEPVGARSVRLLDDANALLTQKFGVIPGRLRQLAGRDDTVIFIARAGDQVLGVTTGEVLGTHDKLHTRYVNSLNLLAPELVGQPMVVRDRAVVSEAARGSGIGSALSQRVLDWALDEVGATAQIGASLASEGGFGAIQRIIHRQGARWLGEVRNFWWSDDPDLVPLLQCPDCDGRVCEETAYVYVNGRTMTPTLEMPVADLRAGEILGSRSIGGLLG